MSNEEITRDKEQVWDEKIRPLVNEIFNLCQENDIPMLIAAVIKHSTTGCLTAASYYNSTDKKFFNEDLAVCSSIVTQESHAVRMTGKDIAQGKMKLEEFLKALAHAAGESDDDSGPEKSKTVH